MASKNNRHKTETKTDKRLATLAIQTEKNKTRILEELPKYPIVQVACERVGVGRATYYKWREEDDGFKKLADKALQAGVQFINDLAESQLLKNMRAGQNVAIIYWLKHRHSDYMEIIRHRHKHMHEIRKDSGIEPEQAELIKRAMGNFASKIRKDEESGRGGASWIPTDKKKPAP